MKNELIELLNTKLTEQRKIRDEEDKKGSTRKWHNAVIRIKLIDELLTFKQ